MKTVEQKMMHCKRCRRTTMHVRNVTTFNWGMNILMMILTLGLWSIITVILLLVHVLNKPLGGQQWICSNCGTRQ
jgi:hypothetical protein